MTDWMTLVKVFGLFSVWTAMSLWAVKWLIVHYLTSHRSHSDEQFDRLEALLTKVENEQIQLKMELPEKYLKRSDEKFDRLEELLTKLESEQTRLKLELPERYVKREDWVRYINVIDAKLDALNERQANTNLQVAALTEKIESLLRRKVS